MPYTTAQQRLFLRMLRLTLSQAQVQQMRCYTQHGDTDTLLHCVAVAYYSHRVACFLAGVIPFHETELIRGALLHDYYLYDWHVPDPSHQLHGFRHPGFALQNAQRDFPLTRREKNIIARHMFPLTPTPPTCREAVLVCLVDKVCSVYETFGRGRYSALRRRCERQLRPVKVRVSPGKQ